MGRVRRGFLTQKQVEVLKLRAMGYTQEDVAKILGTSRENVTIIERRARLNVIRAVETLLAYLEASSLVHLTLPRGTTVREAAKTLLREASGVGVKLRESFSEVANLIETLSGGVEDGRLSGDVTAYVLGGGGLGFVVRGAKRGVGKRHHREGVPTLCLLNQSDRTT